LTGSAYDRGLQHGKLLRNRILAYWEKGVQGKDFSLAVPYEQAMLEYTDKFFPDLVQEVRGIADGAGLPFEQSWRMQTANATGPILAWIDRAQCTNFAFTRSDRGPLLAKTTDGDIDGGMYVCELLTPEQGYRVINVGFAGRAWSEVGLNEAGLAIGSSSCPTIAGQDGYGLPQHSAIRPLLLQCGTVAEALDMLAETIWAGKGLNMCLVDRQGDAAVVEKCWNRMGIRRAEADCVFHTNHFETPEMAQEVGPPGRPMGTSRERMDNLRRQLLAPGSERTFAALRALLSDHTQPGSICRHSGVDGGHSRYGYILAPAEGRMWITDGYPCSSVFLPYQFSDL
jgi:isopenicillin-N N-acyltransferase-like protein